MKGVRRRRSKAARDIREWQPLYRPPASAYNVNKGGVNVMGTRGIEEHGGLAGFRLSTTRLVCCAALRIHPNATSASGRGLPVDARSKRADQLATRPRRRRFSLTGVESERKAASP